ncbi:MAG: hypothetical protein PHY34_03655 [Patescibacteria group bacterium]|nr:hypothetical protein [Patescibacteria group bacterium]MDD5716013.1 hypothetical protein [Patescibacteria group bacterium]
MKKTWIILGIVAAAFFIAPAGFAQTNTAAEVTLFDSTDNYLGGCSLTDTSEWTLSEDLNVTKIQLWYKWQTGETELPVTVTKDGADFASFTALRSACDPYQTSWCNADYTINKAFPAGAYTTKIANAYQCLKPGSTGTVRLYGIAAGNTNEEPSLIAPSPTNENGNSNTNVNLIAGSNSNVNTNADENVNTTAGTADDDEDGGDEAMRIVLVFVVLALLIVIYILIKRKTAQLRSQQPKQ